MPASVLASFLLAIRSLPTFSIVLQDGSLQSAPSGPASSSPDVLSQPPEPPVFFPPSGSGRNPSTLATPVIMTYYPAWSVSRLPPENIDFNYLHWVDFAFAMPTADFTLTWGDPAADPAVLQRLVAAAHSHGTKVKLSIGGWTGSMFFSPAVATDTSRHTFVSNLVTVFHKYDLDGIDIDWEYPGREGNPGNLKSPDDTVNFLAFLQLLKSSLPPTAKISAAASPVPFMGSNGEPLKDVSPFASVLDWILIMNYDTWSASANPGPNAPLFDGCKNSSQPESSALASFGAWTSAGIPPSQLVLGLPAYGYVSRSSNDGLRTRQDTHNSSVLVAHEGSQALFRDLLYEGALVQSAHPAGFEGAGGFEREWDDCSSTPFLRSMDTGQLVTYDDPESLVMKSRFAKDVGMMGVNIWSVDGDTSDWHLLAAIHGSMYTE